MCQNVCTRAIHILIGVQVESTNFNTSCNSSEEKRCYAQVLFTYGYALCHDIHERAQHTLAQHAHLQMKIKLFTQAHALVIQ